MALTSPTLLYCTAEDVYQLAVGDYAIVRPEAQKVAAGVDGVFAAADRWTLTSASTNFETRGAKAGLVIELAKGGGRPSAKDTLAVSSVSGTSITLKRCGIDAGQGEPPAPSAGLSGVEFRIHTLDPQIRRVSSELNRDYGVDELVTGRRSSDLYDPTQLTYACALWTVRDLYLAAARSGGRDADGLWAKYRECAEQLEALLERVSVAWAPQSSGVVTSKRYSRVIR